MSEAQLNPSHTIEVLGVTLGSGPRQRSSKEIQRAKHVSQISARLQVLPCTQKFKAMLAATVLAPAAAWGPILNGRSPTQKEQSEFPNKFWFWGIALICSSTRCKNFWLLYISGNPLIKWACAPTGLRCWRLYGKLCGHYSARNCALGFSLMDMVCGTCLVHLVSCPDCNTISGNIGVPWISQRGSILLEEMQPLLVRSTCRLRICWSTRFVNKLEISVLGKLLSCVVEWGRRLIVNLRKDRTFVPNVKNGWFLQYITFCGNVLCGAIFVCCHVQQMTSPADLVGTNMVHVFRFWDNVETFAVSMLNCGEQKGVLGGGGGPGAPSLSEDIWAGNLALLSRVTMQWRWWCCARQLFPCLFACNYAACVTLCVRNCLCLCAIFSAHVSAIALQLYVRLFV